MNIITLSSIGAEDLYLLRPGSSSAKISNLILSLGSSSYFWGLTTVCFLATPPINGLPLASKLSREFLNSLLSVDCMGYAEVLGITFCYCIGIDKAYFKGGYFNGEVSF